MNLALLNKDSGLQTKLVETIHEPEATSYREPVVKEFFFSHRLDIATHYMIKYAFDECVCFVTDRRKNKMLRFFFSAQIFRVIFLKNQVLH